MSAPQPKITQRQALEACWPYGGPPGHDRVRRGAVLQLQADTGQPEKVCLRKIESLVAKGLAEYGTSPYGAWRTPAGVTLLKQMRAASAVLSGP